MRVNIHHVLRYATTVFIIVIIAAVASPAMAGGSADLTNNGGDRPYLQWNAGQSGGLPRQTFIKVYANAGEELNFGSSTHTSYTDPQDIIFRYWDGAGTVTGTCDVIAGGVGHIENRAEELAGPATAANPGGYEPCTLVAPVDGIYEFEFHAPTFGAGPQNPPPLPVDADFPTDATTNRTVAAWDVTVQASPAPDAANIDGRVYTNLLVLDMGSNGLSLNSIIYVQTFDGYLYRIDMNGIDPFAVSIFSNTKGLKDAVTGNALYQSMQMVGQNPGSILTTQSGIDVKNPLAADEPATYDHTHKIFFRSPDPNLPTTAVEADGMMTWLLNPPQAPPGINNFRFVGAEGTPGQMDPTLGGSFLFESNMTGSYSITIDIDDDGVYDDPIDREFTGTTVNGTNQILWDGLDGLGNPIQDTGNFGVDVRSQTFAGEVHFPFSDPENNRNGIIIERIVGPPLGTTIPEPAPGIVYYNDLYTYDGTNEYDYSLCAGQDGPPPPELPVNVADPRCYGVPPVIRDGRVGVDSLPGGAHEWRANFGDRRIIDTWTYFPSNIGAFIDLVQVRAADLAIDKVVEPIQINPGGSVVFTIEVINKGPSDVQGATVIDGLPPEFINITWTCAVVGTGSCTANGSGNISDTVDLNAGPDQHRLIYTVFADVDPSTPLGTLTNTAVVEPPSDVDDPTPEDNSDPAEIIIVDEPPPPGTPVPTPTAPPGDPGDPGEPGDPNDPGDPGNPSEPPFDPNNPNVQKLADPPVAAPGDLVTWTIIVTNPLGEPITNVDVTDDVPAALIILGVDASAGTATFSGQTVRLQLDVLGAGQVVTVTVRTRISETESAGLIVNNVDLDWPGAPDPPPSGQETLIVVGGLPNTGERDRSVPMGAVAAITLGVMGLALLLAGRRVRRV